MKRDIMKFYTAVFILSGYFGVVWYSMMLYKFFGGNIIENYDEFMGIHGLAAFLLFLIGGVILSIIDAKEGKTP